MSDNLGFEVSNVASVTVCLVCEVALTMLINVMK